jgi:hypothetical protein
MRNPVKRATTVLSAIPLEELVMLTVTYEIDTGAGKVTTKSPLSRTMQLKQAIRNAAGLIGTGAHVSITARGIEYRDYSEILAIWARPGFFQQAQ